MFSKALDNGLSCIPVNNKTGVALVKEWEQFATRLPTEEEVERWDKEFPISEQYGIALVSGPASNVMAIDIDTDDEEVHRIVPKSPYGKRGLPGRATYFFKYNPNFKNITEAQTGVGLYHNKKYSILPPSYHRKFHGQYVWLGLPLLDADNSDLPEVASLDWYDKLPKLAKEEVAENEGRNNTLKKFVTAMRYDSKTEDEIIKFVYEWDLAHHNPRLFTDPKENYRAKNETEAIKAARRFVTNVTQSLLRSGADFPVSFTKKVDVFPKQSKFEQRALPMPPSGLLSSFVTCANASSRFEVTSLALGGAFSFVSAIAANRLKLNDTWPNIYVLGLAGSGTGKGQIVTMIKDLLAGTNLVGCDMYRSSQSFIQHLPEQPQRLDVIDEAAPFFESMKSTANYTSDLADSVNRIFSLGPSRFDGISSVKHGHKSGACYNPCVSIYATVHQTGFLRSMQGYLGSSGLLPRFLIFEQTDLKINRVRAEFADKYIAMENMKTVMRGLFDIYPIVHSQDFIINPNEDGPKNKKVFPREMPMTADARQLLDFYEIKTCEKMIDLRDDHSQPYVARKAEIVTKLTMLTALSCGHDVVQKSDVEYAIEVVETCHHNTFLIRNQVTQSGRVTGAIARVEAYIMRHGQIDRSRLMRGVDLNKHDLDNAIEVLKDEGSVREDYALNGDRRCRIYTYSQKADSLHN